MRHVPGTTAHGRRVVLAGRTLTKVEKVAAEVAERGAEAIALECDVTDTTSCGAAIEKAAAELGGIDALVYTPAIGPLARLGVDGVERVAVHR